MRFPFCTLGVVTLLAAFAGCGGAKNEQPPERIPGVIERFEVNGQPAALIVPAARTGKVVIYTHGSGERVGNIFRDPKKEPVFKTLLQAGYALAATDGHGDNWGSPASERDYLALVRAARERDLDDVYVLALSMGGFNGFALLDRLPVKAWAGIFPACDLQSVYDVGLYPDQIRSAYGLRSGDPAADATRGRSPVAVNPPRGVPMRFWASPADRVIPKGPNTDVCAKLARNRGARVEVTTTAGDHGDPSNYDGEAIRRLFDSAT